MGKIDLEVIKKFVAEQPEGTKIYIGADSERLNIKGVWYADYALAVVVHVGGRHGCKVFGEIIRERDYDQKKSKPRMRLVTEVHKVSELYLKLVEILEDHDVEVHLDINPNEMHASSCVIHEAIGYIRGVCDVVPMVKPKAWAASYCADRLKEILEQQAV